MVGRRDEKRIDILARHYVAEIAIGRAVVVLVNFVYGAARQFELVGFDIAYGDNLGIAIVKKVPHVALPLRSDADAAKADTKLEKDYSRGDDYVSQTKAAAKDHSERQAELEKKAA